MDNLLNIIKNGSKCGIYTIINHNRDAKLPEYERADSYITSLKEQSEVFEIRNNKCYYTGFESPIESDINISEQTSKLFIERYLKRNKSLNPSSMSMNSIIDNNLFERSSRSSLEIPIGVDDDGKTVQLTLGKGSSHHALIAGATGSGKSSLMHTLILSTMLHYRPDEINLYLMDFKSGTEFKIYENYRLPHIKLLALDAMQEFGESILENLVNEMAERSRKFKSVGATNLSEYVSASGNAMPRILIVMDEFQILYNESQNRKIANNCAELTKRIVTEGRSFGIHLVMATQSTTIISELSISSGIIDQMRTRIGLKCTENDARYLFKENSAKALDMMKGPVGTAVMNPEYIEGNSIRLTTAYCDETFKKNCLKVIEDEFYSSEYTMQTFEGSRVKTLLDEYKLMNDIDKDSVNVSVEIAEMIKVAPPLRIVFDKKRKHNVLICGSDEKMANNIFNEFVLGILKNNNSKIYCMDGDIFVSEESFMPFHRQYERFDNRFRLARSNNDIADFVNEIYESFKQRKKTNEKTTIFVVLRNFQYIELCKKLIKGEYFDENEYIDVSEPVMDNNSEEFFDFGVSNPLSSSEGLAAKFSKLINEGSAFGIHFIVSCMEFQAIRENMYYGENVLTKFMDRFVFELSDSDAGVLIDGISVTSLGDNTVYYSDCVKNTCQVKPYLFPDADELEAYIDNGMNDARLTNIEETTNNSKQENSDGLTAIERLNVLCGYDNSVVPQNFEEPVCEDRLPLYLAHIYNNGIGVKENYTEAFKWNKIAAEAGYVSAMNNLGDMYKNGQGVQQNYNAAIEWYGKAIEAGNGSAMTNLAIMYYNGQGVQQNYYEAYQWYMRAIEAGDISAMIYVADMFNEGQGVQQDYNAAFQWLNRAIESGNVLAMNDLGNMYLYGQGVQQNYNTAFQLYKRAAEAGEKTSMYNLGILYEKGKGVQQNYSEAVRWYTKSAEAGDESAMYNLAVLYENGQGVQQDYSEALKWYRKAAEAGKISAMNNLGTMYLNGQGVLQDYSMALQWFIKAAQAGNGTSMYNLAIIYETGQGVQQDYSTAFQWYKAAAEAGYQPAMSSVAEMYKNGLGVKKNHLASLQWHAKAMKANLHL